MKNLHFVGIGGARLSGLAKLYQDRGYNITGSDTQESNSVQNLLNRGIKVFIGHDPVNIEGADLVVYTNAVGNENSEVKAALDKGIPIVEGAELLGKLMSEVGRGIAIAGTHGKTTTTAMTALVLTTGGLDPTVLIGGEIEAFQGNHRSGKSDYMVVEACEFKRSFLYLRPSIELITNIDWDHPDCFPTMKDVIKTFNDFVSLLPKSGTLILWGDDPNSEGLIKKHKGKTITFGYQPQFDWEIAEYYSLEPLGIMGRIKYKGKSHGELRLKVPGRHNLQNAMGALAIASELGIDSKVILDALAEFTGVKRRFEIKGEYHGAMVVDDYAHHPGAVRVTLATARQSFKGRIWCVFQPHLYSRTRFLMDEFAKSFNDADILVLADIYPAREIDPGDISSRDLAAKAGRSHPDVRYLGDFDTIVEHLTRHVRKDDLVITMGAGNIYQIGERLLNRILI
jgi:UDP-N-acetylmuramate--alanine ligase